MLRTPRRAALVATSLVLALPVVATAQDLEDAERDVEELQGQLADATEDYESTWAALEEITLEVEDLERRATELEGELAAAEDALAERAIVMFKRGAGSDTSLLLAARGPAEAADRAALLAALQSGDRARAERAAALRTSLDQTGALLVDRRGQLAELETQLAAERDVLEGQLERAQVVAADLRERDARRREIDRGVQQGTYACIFDRGQLQFRDTWGAPRSGGRRHKGTDVFARMGQPTYAFTDGVISRHSNSGLGGIGLYLRGDDGNVYYYAHLQSIDPNGAVGRRVQAGELVAYNGDTGNARGGAPHVHFEVHPGGGAAINPYPWLAAACH